MADQIADISGALDSIFYAVDQTKETPENKTAEVVIDRRCRATMRLRELRALVAPGVVTLSALEAHALHELYSTFVDEPSALADVSFLTVEEIEALVRRLAVAQPGEAG